jgi:hypothetical protein
MAAKGVSLYATQHPSKEELLSIYGIVRQVRIGGQGKATFFHIETVSRTHRYSSYYGKVWPGMERIHTGDRMNVLAERNRMSKDELINGKRYYIWELIHRGRVIVSYEDVSQMVQNKETAINRYINSFLVASAALITIAYMRKLYSGEKIRR